MTHALVVLLSMLLFAPLLAYVPLASLAGLLLVVAWNMSERRHFATIVRIAPKSDALVLAHGRVPSIDATGLVALESALVRLRRAKKLVVLSGPLPEPRPRSAAPESSVP